MNFDISFFLSLWILWLGCQLPKQKFPRHLQDGSPVLGSGGSRSSPIVEVTRLLAWLVSRVSA